MTTTTTAHMAGWMLQRFPGRAQRRGHQGAITTPGVAAEGEGSRSTGSPGHIENAQKTVRRVEGELRKQEDIRAKGLMEVEKEGSRMELLMAVRGGQGGIVMATKLTARARGLVNTEESKSISDGC